MTGSCTQCAKNRTFGASSPPAHRAVGPITSLLDTGLTQPFDDQFEIVGVLVRQHIAAVFQRIVRVDTANFLSFGTRLVEAVQMTVAGRQQHARGIGVRIAVNSPLEDSDSLVIPAKLEHRLGIEMEPNVRKIRV